MSGGTIERLEEIGRERALTSAEVLRLDRAIRRAAEKREQWYWSRGDDSRLKRYLARGKKPKQIAMLMHRSEGAIWKRMMRLRLRVLTRKRTVQLPPAGESGNS